MVSRLFTPADVDRLVPELERRAAELAALAPELPFLAQQIRDLEEMWGDDLIDADCRDHDEYAELTRRFAEKQSAFHDAVSAIHAVGGELKDVEGGLVDFFAEHEGRLVYLCWKAGEKKVDFYHTLGAGFAGRRPIAELAKH